MATIIAVPNETTSSSSRMSKEGKKITYSMKVIQQPERARACGSGAKCMWLRQSEDALADTSQLPPTAAQSILLQLWSCACSRVKAIV